MVMIALFMVLLFGKLHIKMKAAVTLSPQNKILTFQIGNENQLWFLNQFSKEKLFESITSYNF